MGKQVWHAELKGDVLSYPGIADDKNDRVLSVYNDGTIQIRLRIGPLLYSNTMSSDNAREFVCLLLEAIEIADRQRVEQEVAPRTEEVAA